MSDFLQKCVLKHFFAQTLVVLFVFMLYIPVNIYSVMSGCVCGLNQYLHVAEDKVSCSRTQHSASACVDPERYFRGSPTFFFLVNEWIQIPLISGHHRPACETRVSNYQPFDPKSNTTN